MQGCSIYFDHKWKISCNFYKRFVDLHDFIKNNSTRFRTASQIEELKTVFVIVPYNIKVIIL